MSKFTETIIDSDRCNGCANYLFNLTCLAFPKGIPDDILSGVNPHNKPYPGQGNEITYDKKPTTKNEGLKKKRSR